MRSLAGTQFYKRLCPSIRWLVGWSVVIELKSGKPRISAPAHPSATDGRVSGLVLFTVLVLYTVLNPPVLVHFKVFAIRHPSFSPFPRKTAVELVTAFVSTFIGRLRNEGELLRRPPLQPQERRSIKRHLWRIKSPAKPSPRHPFKKV